MKVEKLLVCSVFAGVEEDRTWYSLQRRFLQKNTRSFDHAIFLGHRAKADDFRDSQIIGQCGPGHEKEHLVGLHAISEYCLANAYDAYLVLDSDAFPVSAEWEKLLNDALKRLNKDYAAAIRI